MILGVDIGGTKTLVGMFNSGGKLLQEYKFATPTSQRDFIDSLVKGIKQIENWQSAEFLSVASPGTIRQTDLTVTSWGRIDSGWQNFPLGEELKKHGFKKIFLQNDASLAALAEARALAKEEDLVLYVTLSTGVGSGIIVKGQLLPELSGSEAGQMIVKDTSGKFKKWEDLASGKSLHQTTNMLASELSDPEAWDKYAQNVCIGLQPAISVLRPNVVILGGGVGAHLEKFHDNLVNRLKATNQSLSYVTPPILQSHYGEKSVLYGCYEYAKDHIA